MSNGDGGDQPAEPAGDDQQAGQAQPADRPAADQHAAQAHPADQPAANPPAAGQPAAQAQPADQPASNQPEASTRSATSQRVPEKALGRALILKEAPWGAIVVVVGLIAVAGIFVTAILTYSKAGEVATATSSVTGVIAALVGAYFGIRGSSLAQEKAQEGSGTAKGGANPHP